MCEKKGMFKKLITTFLFAVIFMIGGVFGNSSFAYEELKEEEGIMRQFDYSYEMSFGSTLTHTYEWMYDSRMSFYVIQNVALISGTSKPTIAGSYSLKFKSPGNYILMIYVSDGSRGYQFKSTITIKQKVSSNSTINKSLTVNKKSTIYLPDFISSTSKSGVDVILPSGQNAGILSVNVADDASYMTVTSKQTGTYNLTIRNNKTNALVLYVLSVKKASTSSNTSSGSYTYTPTYNPSINITSINIADSSKYTQSKEVSFTLTKVDIGSVNTVKAVGKKSGQIAIKENNGKYTFKTNNNETITITASATGLNGSTYTKTTNITVKKIDKKKPTANNFKVVRDKGTNEVGLQLTFKDESKLGYVEVYNPEGQKIETIKLSDAGKKEKLIVGPVSIAGKYKFIIYDEAGNKTTYKTDKVKIDTKAPKIKSFSVINKTTNNSTEDEGVSKISAKTGDTVELNIWTDEKLEEKPVVIVGGVGISPSDIKINSKVSSNKYYKTTVTFIMTDLFNPSTYLPIQITDLVDKWRNVDAEGKIYEKKLFYDVTAPIIKQKNFSATTKAGKQISDKYIEINSENTIKISFATHEVLASDPTVTLAKKTNTINKVTYKKIDGLGFQYETEFKFTEEEVKALKEEAIANKKFEIVQDVIIGNCIDKVGNSMETTTISEDNGGDIIILSTSELMNLTELGGIYIDVVDQKQPQTYEKGDTNKNGVITSFDYLYLATGYYSKDNITANSDEGKDRFDINNDKEVNFTDSSYLALKVNSTKTKIIKNEDNTIKIKLYKDIGNYTNVGEFFSAVTEEFNVQQFNSIKWSDNVLEKKYNSEDSTVTIKVEDLTENIIVEYNGFAGVLAATYISDTEADLKELEDLSNQGKTGLLTLEDRNINYKKTEISGKTEGQTRQGYSKYDLNDDGIITEYDAMMITTGYENDTFIKEYGDMNANGIVDENDAIFIQKMLSDLNNKVIKGDTITLKFDPNLGTSDAYDKIVYKSLDESIATVTDNEDGTATITAVGDVGGFTKILVYAEKDGTKVAGKIFNLEIDDLEVTMQKSDEDGNDTTDSDIKEFTLNKTKEEMAELEITNIDTTDLDVQWKIADENLATLEELEDTTNIQVTPDEIGETTIAVCIIGENDEEITSSTIALEVENNIEKVARMHNGEIDTSDPIKLYKTQTYEFMIVTDPIKTTEECKVSVDDEEILELVNNNGVYTLTALEEGTANIVVEAELGDTKFAVEVTANTNPVIEAITATDTSKNYKAGDVINIEVEFDQNIKGNVPDMKLYFDENAAEGELTGEISGNKIIYAYTVSEEDNGQLYVGNLALGKDETLTDETGIAEADLSKSKIITYREEEDITEESEEETTEESEEETTEESEEETTEELEEETLYAIEGIYVWQTAPTLEANVFTSGDSYSAKDGDTVYVSMTSSKELKEAPVVTIGGQQAEVTGEETNYEASIKISKDTIPEGLLSVKVGKIEDLYENIGEATELNTTENAEDAVIIDYTAPTISGIELYENKEELKEGDQIKIKVIFGDTTKGTTELVEVPVDEDGEYQFPEMKLAFGGKEANGTITAEFLAYEDSEGTVEYSDTIVYTYTLTDGDNGNVSIDSIKGTVYDMAGNETELNETEIKINGDGDEENKDDNDEGNSQDKDNQNNGGSSYQGKTEKENQATGTLPYAGKVVGTGIISIIIGVVALVIRKRFFLK